MLGNTKHHGLNRRTGPSLLICAMLLGCSESDGGIATVASSMKDAQSQPAASSASGATTSPIEMTPQLQAMAQVALDDVARRFNRDRASLHIALAESVTWPDGSLGCPNPDMAYPQALAAGFRIRVAAGNETFEYHAGVRGQPFYCPPSRITQPTADSRI